MINNNSGLGVDNIIELMSFYLSSNCFLFNDTYCSQVYGETVGSAFSVRIAEIIMRFLENKINSHL